MSKIPAHEQNQKTAVIERLEKKGLNVIALIDDAFDPFNAQDVSPEKIAEFWSSLQNRKTPLHKDKKQEFEAFVREHIGDTISSKDEIDNDFLLKLWEQRNTFKVLKQYVDELFSSKIGKIQQLERIHYLISEACTKDDQTLVEIKTFNSRILEKLEELDQAGIILLDYVMGGDNSPIAVHQAKENAKVIAKKIKSKFSKKRKLPLIILMSSDESVIKAQDQFQKDTGWLKGLFYCIAKADLKDESRVKINLGTWIERLEEGTNINQFVNVIQKSLKTATQQFIQSINNLSLEDYAYVHQYSLKAEGQPLGEYMLWLFNAYLGRLAFEANDGVKRRQKEIDQISSPSLSLNQLMPSTDLIEMYDSALFDKHIGKLVTHKVKFKQKEVSKSVGVASGKKLSFVTSSSGGKEGSLPYLRLGFLFTKDENSPVLMIVNADCDLMFTPKGKRSPTPVLALIEGQLHEINKSKIALKEYDTEFFKYEGKVFHISWQTKSVTFCEYPKLLGYLKKNKYSLYALLRDPFALKVQQAYASNFARIALPVAPPIEQDVNIEIFYKDLRNRGQELISSTSELAFLTKVRDETSGEKQWQCQFTPRFMGALNDALNSLVVEYQRNVEEIQNDLNQLTSMETRDDERIKTLTTKKQGLELNIDRLRNTIAGFVEWALNKPIHIFKEDIDFLDENGVIAISRNKETRRFQQWGDCLLVVNVQDLLTADSNVPTLEET